MVRRPVPVRRAHRRVWQQQLFHDHQHDRAGRDGDVLDVGHGRPPANVAAAVAQCKQEIQAQPTLSSTAKTKLEGVCEEAAKGNGEAVKKAAREVCEEVIKSSPVPAGAAQEQALAACRTK